MDQKVPAVLIISDGSWILEDWVQIWTSRGIGSDGVRPVNFENEVLSACFWCNIFVAVAAVFCFFLWEKEEGVQLTPPPPHPTLIMHLSYTVPGDRGLVSTYTQSERI